MESDSSDPPPRTGAPGPITDGNGDTGQEPFDSSGISSSLFHTAAPLLGLLLGICTLTLPLAGVITDRGPAEAPAGLTTARQP